MLQIQNGDEIDDFIRRFRSDPRTRAAIVSGLVSSGRLTLNIPGSGLARRIADRLREGPFSDYYEFEKLLARALHPLLANLNLNAVADILVNRLFSERYLLYARDVNVALASGGKLSPGDLKTIIANMAEAEGHYMVIKFCDLVLRGNDLALARSLKLAEEAVIRMKGGAGDDDERIMRHVGNVFREFRDRKGGEAAEVLLARMEWDSELRDHVPRLADEAGLEGYAGNETTGEDEGGERAGLIGNDVNNGGTVDDFTGDDYADDNDFEPEVRSPKEDAVTRYARMIKSGYLDAVDPDDEGKIRGIVKGIYIKNEKVYDSEKASDTVRKVIALWLADSSLDDRVRGVLTELANEGDMPGDADEAAMVEDHEEAEGPLPGTAAPEEPASEAMTGSGPAEGPAADDGLSVEDVGDLVDDITQEKSPEEPAVRAGHEVESQERSGEPGGVMDELLEGISEETPAGEHEEARAHGVDASAHDIVSGDELDALLENMPDEGKPGEEVSSPGPGSEAPSMDDSGLSDVEQEALLDGFAGETAGDEAREKTVEAAGSAGSEIVSGDELDALLDSFSEEVAEDKHQNEPLEDTGAAGNEIVSGNEMDALLDGISEEPAMDEKTVKVEPAATVGDDDFLLGEEETGGRPGPSADKPAGAGTDDAFLLDDMEPVLTNEPVNAGPGEMESFVVKDEILFEDRSIQRKAEILARRKPAKVRITMRDLADTPKRKNLLSLLDLIAETDPAGDVSTYLVGAGVSTGVRTALPELIKCDDYDDAVEFIRASGSLDHQEKIIILQKWLKPAGMKMGWFDPPHEERVADVGKMIETIAARAMKARMNEGGVPHGAAAENADGASGMTGSDDTVAGPGAPVDIQQKEMLMTGDESIRLSHEFEEFRDLYTAGIDDAAIAERVPAIQRFFDRLVAGEESAVHFAVYHTPAFNSLVRFIGDNPGLKEQLDTGPALKYCKKKKII